MKKNREIIVIMGGSFNPPTLAHYLLMNSAIEALNALCGYFVPVSDAYLKRKMRHSHPPIVLSSELRIKMLNAMCLGNKMKVCDKEIGTIEARTIPTLKLFKEEFPEYELYFVMGDDKLDLLSHLAEKRAFFEISNVILYSRNLEGIEERLRNHDVLSKHFEKIVVLPQPEEVTGISSSLIRERMLLGESCEELLVPVVWEIFKELKSNDFPDVIDSFKGEYDFLNNRYERSFVWNGIKFNNAESAFYASKCTNEEEIKLFSRMTITKAAIRSAQITPYPGWEEDRLNIMQSILSAKFEQNPDLMRKLIDTDKLILINGNNKQETYWGVDLYSWEGENNLGKILMTIREKEKTK